MKSFEIWFDSLTAEERQRFFKRWDLAENLTFAFCFITLAALFYVEFFA